VAFCIFDASYGTLSAYASAHERDSTLGIDQTSGTLPALQQQTPDQEGHAQEEAGDRSSFSLGESSTMFALLIPGVTRYDRLSPKSEMRSTLAALSALAGLAVAAAAGLSLVALYRWVLMNYGEFYGLAAVGGVLILIAVILSAGALWWCA
jgi:hypothetical protein